jgi:apolipoprotein D and lipocalin family protein
VGGGNSDYLWILSRTPRLEERAKNVLLSEASIRGYDISKLIWVDQRVE